MKMLNKLALALPAIVLGLALLPGLTSSAVAVDSGTPPGMTVIWHDGELWNSVVLGDLHGNPPAHTLDALYIVPGQNLVAGAGPGDSDFNGGRWIPTMVAWVGGGPQPLFTDGDAVEAAIGAGDLMVTGTGTPFLCPLTGLA